jgi:peptide deformylase
MILTSENQLLHAIAKPVDNFTSDDLKLLIEQMFQIMRAKDGVGLAAPQIGVSVRIFVYGFESSPRYPDAPAVPVMAAINPEIIWQSEETSDYEEGCLSVPYKRGMITRSKSITFTYYDIDGKQHEKTVYDFEARIVQHEIDHLNGILISDRAKELRENKIA